MWLGERFVHLTLRTVGRGSARSSPIGDFSSRRFSQLWAIGQDESMISTDDEHELDPKSGPAWKRYEMDIREALNEMDDSEVTHNVTVKGALSKVDRQIDVLIERNVAGSRIRIAVECKTLPEPTGHWKDR